MSKKYVYKFPEAQDPRLVISHSIFLNANQRLALQQRGTEVETSGISMPVWIDSQDRVQEVFCRYIIRYIEDTPENPEMVSLLDDGYVITICKWEIATRMLLVKEGGNDGFSYAHSDTIHRDDKAYPVIHQVSVLPMETLESSMYFLSPKQISG